MTLETVPYNWRMFRVTSLVAAALGLLLMTTSSYAQTAMKEITVSQLTALQLDGVLQTFYIPGRFPKKVNCIAP